MIKREHKESFVPSSQVPRKYPGEDKRVTPAFRKKLDGLRQLAKERGSDAVNQVIDEWLENTGICK